MIRAMYGDWERYCVEVHRAFCDDVFDGIVGSCVMMRRAAYDKIGGLDERVQAADWDLYYTLRKREQEVGDVKRVKVLGATFVHHFIRATIKSKREPFACTHERWLIDNKWSRAEQARLWCKPEEFLPQSQWGGPLHRHVVKPFKKLLLELDRATAFRRLWSDPKLILEEYRRQFDRWRRASPPLETSG